MAKIKYSPIKASEHAEQVALLQFCKYMALTGKDVRLGLLFAIPNGAKMPYRRNANGQRYSPEAQRMLAEGLQPGVPDLLLPVACQGYHGLFLEMKVKGNKPTDDQLKWHAHLREQGYKVEVPYSADEAAITLLDYLGIERRHYEDWRGI